VAAVRVFGGAYLQRRVFSAPMEPVFGRRPLPPRVFSGRGRFHQRRFALSRFGQGDTLLQTFAEALGPTDVSPMKAHPSTEVRPMFFRFAGLVSLVFAVLIAPAIGRGVEVDEKAKGVLSDWYQGLADAKTIAGETTAVFQVIQAGTEVQAQRDGYSFALKRPQHFSMRAKDAAGLTLVNDDNQFFQALGAGKVYTQDKPFAAVGDLFSKSVILSQTNLQQGLSLLGEALGAESFAKFVEGLGDIKYVGEETVDGQKVHHLSVVFQKTPHEAWFSAEAKPKILKLVPDLKTIAAANGRELPKEVDLKLTVAFTKWAYDEALPADAFAAVPPKDFELVTDLFAPPAVRMIGKKAPAFELPTLAGSPFKLGDQEGKVVVLDFWATWCGPCVAALPKINETTAKYKEKGVVFQAVNQGEEASIAKEFLAAQKLDVPVILDQEGKVGTLFKVEGIPQTVIIDKTGKIQAVHVGAGPTIGEQLAKELDDILSGKDLSAAKH
jgi:thiol-disulfide isomerase/thioredoxin